MSNEFWIAFLIGYVAAIVIILFLGLRSERKMQRELDEIHLKNYELRNSFIDPIKFYNDLRKSRGDWSDLK